MRIYKGSEITLKLYTRINCQSIETDKMRVVLFTTNPNNSYMVNNVVVSGNTLLVTVGRNDLNSMEDGVINYIILGYDDNEEIYNSTRQSNYYLKTPDGYVAKSIQTSKDVYIVDNGDYKILPDEDYSSIEEVNVHVEFDAEPYIQRGIELGEENQKSKLESVSITENGTYTREDGYNEIHVEVPDLNGDFQTGYDEGYTDGYAEGEAKGVENAGEIVAANAIVLDATENKTYYTKYSDNIQYPEVTGVFPNGENFYNDISLKDTKTNFSGEYQITPSSKIEIWWNNQNTDLSLGRNNFIFGFSSFLSIYNPMFSDHYTVNFFSTEGFDFTFEYVGWHHIVLSANGLFINDKKIGDFNINLGVSDVGNIFNINNYAKDEFGANGSYGMIKLDDTIIIPTADGFLNTNTNELLNKSGNSYLFSNNTPIILDNLIKQVNVNTKIDIAKAGIKFGYSSFPTIPEWADFSNVIDMSNLFNGCNSLTSIPSLDTSNVIDMSYMFAWVDYIPSLPTFNVPKVTNISNYFRYGGANLIDVGGWINLNCNWNDNYGLARCSKLTYQSCINILNGLYDFRGNGDANTTRTLKVHSNFLTTVGDEISIGIAKGWIISA